MHLLPRLSFVLATLALPLSAGNARQEAPPPVGETAVSAPAPQPTTLVPSESSVEFGDVFEGEALRRTVIFTNVGAAPWQVQQVSTSCGCTVAKLFAPDGSEIPNKPRPQTTLIEISPNEAIKVDVEFNTSGQHGAVEKKVQVFNVDPAIPPVLVPVHAKVSKALVVTPNMLNLGTIGKGERIEKSFTIESQDIGAWDVTGFVSAVEGQPLPEWMTFEVVPGSGNKREVTLVLESGRPVGAVSPRVRVEIQHERLKHIDLFVTGTVMPDVVFSSGHATFPQNISFDQMDPGQKVTRTLHIKNNDPNVPYVLESIELKTPRPEYFEYEITTIKEGEEYEVNLTANGDIGETYPFFRGTLELHAQHPDVATKAVPFHGWVRKA